MINLFLLNLFGSILGLSGGLLFLFSKKLSKFLEKHSVPFAAGVLITVSFLGLVPEAFEQIGETSLIILIFSFFAAFLFEHFIVYIHHHEHGEHKEKNRYRHSVPLVIVGDTIHNFIDGVAITASFLTNPGLGFITAISTFLHEVPHEVGDFAILLRAGYSPKKVVLINLISACFSFGGMLLALFLATDSNFVGIMLSISAGIFLYLGTVDFLPNIFQGYKRKIESLIPLFIGIVSMIIALMAIPHSH